MSALYRPSNSTEGGEFMDRWCGSCRHDADYCDDCDGAGCTIAARAIAFRAHEPGFPAEWVMGERGPVCTAWEPMADDGTGRIEAFGQAEMAL